MYDDPDNLTDYPCEPPKGGRNTTAPSTDADPSRDAGMPVHARLPPAVIQKIVRQHFGEYRRCYEEGMRRDPKLHGRVAIHFVIERSGAVSDAYPVCTSLPDREAVRCIAQGFARLSFPEPEGGMVTVIYPIMFNPAD
jgi:hypothetical protein